MVQLYIKGSVKVNFIFFKKTVELPKRVISIAKWFPANKRDEIMAILTTFLGNKELDKYTEHGFNLVIGTEIV